MPPNSGRPKMAASLTAKESAKQLQALIDDQHAFGKELKNIASNDNLDEIVRIRPNESLEKLVSKQRAEK